MWLAALVGFWSLCGQFILNRIIFFYIANSEYAAASIISLHLLGFLLGSLAARKWRVPASLLTAASLAVTALAQLILWTWGALVFGFAPMLGMALAFALLLAFFSGFLVVRLMEPHAPGASSTAIIVADSAGSVAGAMVGGFVLIPKFGLQASFAIVAAFQAVALLLLTFENKKQLGLTSAGILAVALVMSPLVTKMLTSGEVIAVEGLPLVMQGSGQKLVFQKRSPFGILAVLEGEGGHRELRIDNRQLCGAFKNSPENKAASEWVVGSIPAYLAAAAPAPRVAVVGLGCGVTLAAALAELPDMVEINPAMEEAQKKFHDYVPHNPDDPRVKLIIRDGFAHFADLPENTVYDAVAIDVAWMASMNATHLFSVEMYQNIARHMTDRAVLGVWSEEGNPFSPISLMLYHTLKSVFREVRVDATHGVVVFYAAKAATPGLDAALPQETRQIGNWIDGASYTSHLNTLDDLAMNRYKFTLWGDSIKIIDPFIAGQRPFHGPMPQGDPAALAHP